MTPKTPDELAQAIDALVASYVGEVRRVAQSALDDAFSRAVASRRPTGARRRLQRPERCATSTGRRSPDEMSDSVEKLYAVVCAHPGESMTVFASELELLYRVFDGPCRSYAHWGEFGRWVSAT